VFLTKFTNRFERFEGNSMETWRAVTSVDEAGDARIVYFQDYRFATGQQRSGKPQSQNDAHDLRSQYIAVNSTKMATAFGHDIAVRCNDCCTGCPLPTHRCIGTDYDTL
jgi:hypothetical protein